MQLSPAVGVFYYSALFPINASTMFAFGSMTPLNSAEQMLGRC
jgi:hypothetical protein